MTKVENVETGAKMYKVLQSAVLMSIDGASQIGGMIFILLLGLWLVASGSLSLNPGFRSLHYLIEYTVESQATQTNCSGTDLR